MIDWALKYADGRRVLIQRGGTEEEAKAEAWRIRDIGALHFQRYEEPELVSWEH
jgi:hypothetical protein